MIHCPGPYFSRGLQEMELTHIVKQVSVPVVILQNQYYVGSKTEHAGTKIDGRQVTNYEQA